MKTSKLFVILTFVLLCGTNLFASRIPDCLIYQGSSYPLHGYPMEQYFAEFPEKRPDFKALNVNTIESRTGYVATLEFVGNQLYLKDFQLVEGFGYIGRSIISELLINDERLKIDWLSKPIVLMKGKAVKTDSKEAFIYESYIILEIRKGKLLKTRNLNHQEYKNYMKEQYLSAPKNQVK